MSVIQFACEKCDKELEYGADAAGLQVRCPGCRTPITVPETASSPPARERPTEVAKPKKKKKKKRPPSDDSLDGKRPSHTPEWIIPVVMIVLGLILSMVARTIAFQAGPLVSLKAILLETVISVPITLVAMYVAVLLLDVSFGELPTAALKVAGIVIGGNGAIWLCIWIGFPVILIWVMSLVFTYTFFAMLFCLDPQEAIMSIIIVTICRMSIARAIVASLM
jgi:hypothetical protein